MKESTQLSQFDRTYNIMKNPITLIGFLIFVTVSFLYIDKPVATYFHALDLRINWPWLYWITVWGEWKIYALFFLALGFYFQFLAKDKSAAKKTWLILSCIIVSSIINYALKIILSRARPELLFSSNQYGFYWLQLKNTYWSMPSGHATGITAVVASLGFIFSKSFYALLILVILVTASRVLMYYHYLSDVLVGFYLTMLVVGVLVSFFRKKLH